MWVEYTWIVVCGAVLAIFVGYGIGANDVANAFGTSVGSKAISIKQALIIAAVFEFAGAVLLGANVTNTVSNGIVWYWDFMDTPELYMYGMLCVLLSSGIWLILASYWELPVSTTHATVGGIVGMTLVAFGPSSVNWATTTDHFPYVSGIAAVVSSWFISPVLSGILATLLFWLVRLVVLRSPNSYSRSFIAFPFLVFFTVMVNMFFILFKGAEKKIGRDGEEQVQGLWALWISLGVAGGSALIVGVVISPLLKRKIDRTFAEQEQANNERMDEPAQRLPSSSVGSVASSGIAGLKGDMEAAQGGESGMVESIARTNTKANWSAISSTLTKGLNVDIHSALEKDELVGDIHKKSEKFDPRTEESFKYLQVFTAICDSFGHGANDVANSIGPFAAIWSIYQHQGIEKKSEVPVWILAMGGIGIVVGLATYGYKIMSAIGIKMCRITASRGFAIELGAAMVIIMGSRLGIPLSTTHCQVGATVAVGLLEGNQNVNWPLVVRVMAGWAVTLFVVGGTSAMLFAQGAYAPSKLNLRQLLEYQRGIEGNVADMVYVLEQPFFTHSPNGDLITAALGNISQALFEVSDTQNVYAVQELTLLNYTLNTYMLATTPLEQLEVVSYRFGVETMAPPNGTDPSADTLHYYT